MTPSDIRPYLNNNIDIEGVLKSNMNVIGLRNTECLNSDFLIEINYAWMQVWTTPETIFNGIKELKEDDYIHMKGIIRTVSTRHTRKMEEIVLECKEVVFTGNLKEFVEYKDLS